ncbi:MAG: DUF5681 domain-containing protein [Pseudomonadota bacterium]
MSDKKQYDVGYGKPPKAGQFKKGQSGNPKGRPKGSNNLSTDVKEILKTPVAINEGGKPKKVSTQQAMLLRLRQDALKGDAKAIDQLVKLASAFNNEALVASGNTVLDSDDEAVLKEYLLRQQSTEGRKGDA